MRERLLEDIITSRSSVGDLPLLHLHLPSSAFVAVMRSHVVVCVLSLGIVFHCLLGAASGRRNHGVHYLIYKRDNTSPLNGRYTHDVVQEPLEYGARAEKRTCGSSSRMGYVEDGQKEEKKTCSKTADTYNDNTYNVYNNEKQVPYEGTLWTGEPKSSFWPLRPSSAEVEIFSPTEISSPQQYETKNLIVAPRIQNEAEPLYRVVSFKQFFKVKDIMKPLPQSSHPQSANAFQYQTHSKSALTPEVDIRGSRARRTKRV